MIVAPILLPLLFGILSLFAWQHKQIQRVLAGIGSLSYLAVAIFILRSVQQNGIQVAQIGNWPAPFGISLVIDLFSALMLVVSGFLAVIIGFYSFAGIDPKRVRFGFYPLFHFLLVGVNGAFSTGDLFNLYVWFEVMLMSSFVLIALGGERPQIEGAVKYVVLNLISSVMFLSAIGLTYNLVGTLNFADLAVKLPAVQPNGQVTIVAVLFLIAFGIKSAAFPLFFWLPASYHTPPVTVTALFSGLLTKVGVYALIRFFTLIFIQDTPFTHTIILVMAGFTMVSGVLGAAAQTDFRRLLSFHIVSQIGYLLMGLGLYSQTALTAAIYFMVHVILAKTALFLVAGVVNQIQGSFDLKQLGGLYKQRPWLSIVFLLPALSLAGLPPLSGFFAKLGLVIAGFEEKQYLIIAIALAVSVMTLYSMTKVWNEAFWKKAKNADPQGKVKLGKASAWMWAPLILIVVVSTAIGLFAGPLFDLANAAANQLIDPAIYISAVFGGT